MCLLVAIVIGVAVRMRQLGHSEVFPVLALALVTVVGTSVLLTGMVNGSARWVGGGAAAAVVLMFHSLLWAVPSLEHNLGGITSAKELADRILDEDPSNKTTVVMYRATALGLTFYLQRPVYVFQPTNEVAESDEPVFEYAHHHGSGANVIRGEKQLRQLFGGTARVFCVTKMKGSRELPGVIGMPMYRLEEVGRWVLWSNQPAKQK